MHPRPAAGGRQLHAKAEVAHLDVVLWMTGNRKFGRGPLPDLLPQLLNMVIVNESGHERVAV